MKIYATFFVASIAVFSVSCFAETLCSKTSNDAELYQCSVKYKSQAEKELNHEYGLARERIVQMYGAQKKLGEQYAGIMVDTQRNWLKFRDGQCHLEAFAAEEGSNPYDVTTNLCIYRMDTERTAVLKQLPY